MPLSRRSAHDLLGDFIDGAEERHEVTGRAAGVGDAREVRFSDPLRFRIRRVDQGLGPRCARPVCRGSSGRRIRISGACDRPSAAASAWEIAGEVGDVLASSGDAN